MIFRIDLRQFRKNLKNKSRKGHNYSPPPLIAKSRKGHNYPLPPLLLPIRGVELQKHTSSGGGELQKILEIGYGKKRFWPYLENWNLPKKLCEARKGLDFFWKIGILREIMSNKTRLFKNFLNLLAIDISGFI